MSVVSNPLADGGVEEPPPPPPPPPPVQPSPEKTPRSVLSSDRIRVLRRGVSGGTDTDTDGAAAADETPPIAAASAEASAEAEAATGGGTIARVAAAAAAEEVAFRAKLRDVHLPGKMWKWEKAPTRPPDSVDKLLKRMVVFASLDVDARFVVSLRRSHIHRVHPLDPPCAPPPHHTTPHHTTPYHTTPHHTA